MQNIINNQQFHDYAQTIIRLNKLTKLFFYN